MADELRVQKLLDEILDSDRNPEDVCRNCPELLPAVRQRWPLAMDINRAFAVELRTFLHQYRTTRNGRPGGTPSDSTSSRMRLR